MTAANRSTGQTVNVLFVCLGNICRSPMAEGVFRNIAANHPLISNIDSAGTGAYHAGESSDSRTMSTLRRHGIRNYHHLARKVTLEDFLNFDYLLAMDEYNLEDLLELRASIMSSSSKTAGRMSRGKGTRAATAASITASVEAGAKVAEVRLFGDYGPEGSLHERVGGGEVVQDPYYGGANGFEAVYQQVARFSNNFLQYLEKKNQN